MGWYFVVYYSQRRGLGPQWDVKSTEVGIDDVEPDADVFELARGEFKDLMRRRGLSDQEYIIKDIISV